ncbi:MAG: FtsX-like permease family protein [Pseudomonadales bacterium]|nr:FtsX-like permease family protein [Pseudomonadales bacterium]
MNASTDARSKHTDTQRPALLRQALALAVKLLLRRPSAPQWLYIIALLYAVGLVAGMLLFTGRVEQAIYRENASLLAADLQVESSRSFVESNLQRWQAAANARGLQSQQSVELASMLYLRGELLLSRVLAVEAGYPLRGQLLIAEDLEAAAGPAGRAPARGEIWLDARAARQLGANPGDLLELGRATLRFAAVLAAEPGVVLPSLGLAGNALININDIPDTGLIVPGSRASWRWSIAGSQANIDSLSKVLQPELAEHQRLRSNRSGADSGNRVVANALDYLNLGAGVALIMAMLACLVAGRQFIGNEQQSVTILKALGFSSRCIVLAYGLLFTLWWLLATLLGCMLGYAFVSAGFHLLAPTIDVPAVSPLVPMLFAAIVALGVAATFVLPALHALARVAPQRLLRQSASAPVTFSVFLLLPMVALLLALLGGSVRAALAMLAGTIVLALFSWVATALLMFVLGKCLARPAAGAAARASWRMGSAAFLRQRRNSSTRVVALSTTLALVVVIVGLRENLLGAWQAQLPPDAPNYFAVNVPATQAQAFDGWLERQGFASQGVLPVARGRLLEINGVDAQSRVSLHSGNARSLAREFVITQSALLPLDNIVVDGQWHGDTEQAEVSAEQGIVDRLGLKLGDKLLFSFAGQPLQVSISSIRSLRWESMQPNFYFMLAEPLLTALPHSYMGSFHVPEGNDELVAQLVERFPATTLIDLAAVIAQLERVVGRAAMAVEVLALLTVVAAVLVVATSLRASLQSRLQEQRLLRALGASARDLRRIAWFELGLSGAVAGVVGSATGSVLLMLLAKQWFGLSIYLEPMQLLGFVTVPALLVLLAGAVMLREAYRVSPVLAWRK